MSLTLTNNGLRLSLSLLQDYSWKVPTAKLEYGCRNERSGPSKRGRYQVKVGVFSRFPHRVWRPRLQNRV